MSCRTEVVFMPMWGSHNDLDKFNKDRHDRCPLHDGMYVTKEFVGYNYPEQLKKELIDKYPGICFVGYISSDNGTCTRSNYDVIFGACLVKYDSNGWGIIQIGRGRESNNDNYYIARDECRPYCMRGYKEFDTDKWCNDVEELEGQPC